MNVFVRRICAPNHATNPEVKRIGDELIEDINNFLINEDLLLVEDNLTCQFEVVLIESGGSEQIFVDQLNEIQKPVILISTCKNNSLAASFEIRSYCTLNKIQCLPLLGDADFVASGIIHFFKVVPAYKSIKGSNLAIIGGISSWLIASRIENSTIKDKFDINVIEISKEELYSEIDKFELLKRLPKYNEVLEKFNNKEEVDKAYNIYCALKRLVKKYKLSGLTLKCFDLVEDYKTTACLALALLNDEGIVCSCEGDMPSLLTMFFAYKLSEKSCFMANPSDMNYNDYSLVLSHCTVPFSMTKEYSLTTHFESNLGIGIKGELKNQEVTILKISPSFKRKDLLCMSSEIIENLSLPNFCRTQILVQLSEENFFDFYHKSFANHVIVVYSDISTEFYGLLELFDTF